jgi:phosphoglycerate dehydrogenase-like enzyme
MKIAVGRSFYALVKARTHILVPDVQWALVDPYGSWSESPDECDLLVLAGDTYTSALVEQVVKLPRLRWAHTEDAGTDGFFYDTMRARGVTVTHSPGANAVEVAEFAFALLLWSAKRLGDFQAQQGARQWRLLRLASLSDKDCARGWTRRHWGARRRFGQGVWHARARRSLVHGSDRRG